MFKGKNLDELLGVGRVRANMNLKSKPDQPQVSDEIGKSEVTEEPAGAEELTETVKPVFADAGESAQPIQQPAIYEQRLIEHLESQLRYMERQLEIKDDQLASKDEIIKNFQVLLKIEQEHVLKLTEGIKQPVQNEAASPQTPKNKWFFWRKNEQGNEL